MTHTFKACMHDVHTATASAKPFSHKPTSNESRSRSRAHCLNERERVHQEPPPPPRPPPPPPITPPTPPTAPSPRHPHSRDVGSGGCVGGRGGGASDIGGGSGWACVQGGEKIQGRAVGLFPHHHGTTTTTTIITTTITTTTVAANTML